jgi:hypothetical protein
MRCFLVSKLNWQKSVQKEEEERDIVREDGVFFLGLLRQFCGAMVCLLYFVQHESGLLLAIACFVAQSTIILALWHENSSLQTIMLY